MIVKRNLHSSGKILGNYLTRMADNEAIDVISMDGVFSKDVKSAVIEMDNYKKMTKANFGLYHFQLAPSVAMTPDEIKYAIDTTLEECDLKGRPAVWVLHQKNGKAHIHGAVQRFDHKKGKMDKNGLWAKDQDRARRKIEVTLGHPLTPLRNPNHQNVKEDMTSLWYATKTEKQFIQEAEKMGYKIAFGGNKRPFHVVDKLGVAFNLARKIDGIKTAELYARINPANLIKLADATKVQKQHSEEFKATEKKQAFNSNSGDIESEKERMKREIMEQIEQMMNQNSLKL